MPKNAPVQNPIHAQLRRVFGVAIAAQASLPSKEKKKQIREIIRWTQSRLFEFSPRLSRHAIVRVDEHGLDLESEEGPLCRMMTAPRGRLDGSGFTAAIILKVLVIAYLEAKDNRLQIDLDAWRSAAEQDLTTRALKSAIRGHERQFSDELVALFRAYPNDGLPRFTNICRIFNEALLDQQAVGPLEVLHNLFKKELVETLSSTSNEPELRNKKANSLSKQGTALRHKVKFLVNGRCKNG